LPEDVVVTVMSGHQRYFPVEDDSGALMPLFVAVRNGDERGLDTVREGNERVIVPRLADAEFYMQEDLQVPLADRLEGLKRVTYIEGMGSLYDMAQRLEQLVGWLGSEVEAVSDEEVATATRAALLAKCDLTTSMIGDTKLAALQGRIGGEYAARSGERAEVAQAIAEQYRPRGLAAPCPDLLDAYDRALALAEVREQDESFDAVIIAAERCANIVRPVKAEQELKLRPEMLTEPAAIALHEAYQQAQQRASQALAGEDRDYAAAWAALCALREPIDTFFDDVLVMAEDEAVRNNRLALVGAIDDSRARCGPPSSATATASSTSAAPSAGWRIRPRCSSPRARTTCARG